LIYSHSAPGCLAVLFRRRFLGFGCFLLAAEFAEGLLAVCAPFVLASPPAFGLWCLYSVGFLAARVGFFFLPPLAAQLGDRDSRLFHGHALRDR